MAYKYRFSCQNAVIGVFSEVTFEFYNALNLAPKRGTYRQCVKIDVLWK